ncbi:asparagine synthase-related protein [Arundinibacter roseus]|nr:asparagine synthase-related protein [Arundinibacter roseus]
MGRKLAHRGGTELYICPAFKLGQHSSNSDYRIFSKNGITIVSDARIDNQAEILEKIGLSASLILPENELIYQAYLKLSTGFIENLTGDFSIVLVDETKRKVLLIRDHMGIRPLYYSFKKKEFLAIASEPKALLSLDFIPEITNQEKCNEYLQWPTDSRPYSKTTFFEGIYSVIPATFLEFDLDLSSFEETFYWKINHKKFSHLTSKTVLIKEYRRVFEQAVRRRLQLKTGAHVSGGLDSSSVYKIAELNMLKKNLFSVHFYPDSDQADERDYARTIIQSNQENHFQIDRRVDSIPRILKIQESIDRPDPSTIPTSIKILPELCYFKEKGVTVVLTGHEGDTVVDTGISHIYSLLKNSEFENFKEKLGGTQPTNLDKRIFYITRALAAKYSENGLTAAFKFLWEIISHNCISVGELVRIVKFSHLIRLLARFSGKNQQENHPKSSYCPPGLSIEMQQHFRRIHSAGILEMNETFNLAGAAFGIEYAHPFLDKDFIELSLHIPGNLRIGPLGIRRYNFREAMTGVLPENVRLRQAKISFNQPIWQNLTEMVNSYLLDETLDIGLREKLETIHKELSKMDRVNPDFSLTKKYQREVFLMLWEKYWREPHSGIMQKVV